jgi:hypothetical protein
MGKVLRYGTWVGAISAKEERKANQWGKTQVDGERSHLQKVKQTSCKLSPVLKNLLDT